MSENATPSILEAMAATFRERNAEYKDSAILVGAMMAAAHPEGVTLTTAEDHHLFHLWSLIFVKLARFANSGLKHVDSIHDAAIYAAMIEAILRKRAPPPAAH